jgi:hypothetical protein
LFGVSVVNTRGWTDVISSTIRSRIIACFLSFGVV